MKKNKELKQLYLSSYDAVNRMIDSKKFEEREILKIISDLNLEKEFKFLQNNNYDLNSVSELFRLKEEELKESFEKDQERFHILFKMYLLEIELFTILCELFSFDKEKRNLIDPIFQVLKESKTLLKFFIPFDKKEIHILNNIIGEQLYNFIHVQYTDPKDKELDYIFEKYLLNCEKMLHGLELSISSNFGGNPYKKREIEEIIFLNNLSFLLLKMSSKLKFYRPNEEYLNNSYFLKIIDFVNKIDFLDKKSLIDIKKDYGKTMLRLFLESSSFLKKEKDYNLIDEKIKLLELNTDEYKELIDIITSSK